MAFFRKLHASCERKGEKPKKRLVLVVLESHSGPGSEGDWKEVILLGFNSQSLSVRNGAMAGLCGRYGTMEGTELPKTSQRQRGRNTRFSFPNTFQPPISAPPLSAPSIRVKNMQPATDSLAAHSTGRQGGRVGLRAESARPTQWLPSTVRENHKEVRLWPLT